MGEVTEKIYCCDRGDNDNALAAAVLANSRRDDWGPMAAMMNNNSANNWMNNPFAYLMFLALFRNGGFGWNNGDGSGPATQGIETQAQLNAIRTQLQDTSNADCIKSAIQGNALAMSQLAQALNIDANTIQKSCCDIQAAIQQVAGQVGFSAERVINAANLGNLNIIQQLKDCCCTTQQNITSMGYQSQLGQKDIINSIQMQTLAMQQGHNNITTEILRNLATITAQNQQDKCDILRNSEINTQRIVDVLNQHWQADLQQRYNDARLELSQQRQNAELIAALKTTTT